MQPREQKAKQQKKRIINDEEKNKPKPERVLF